MSGSDDGFNEMISKQKATKEHYYKYNDENISFNQF